MDYQLSPLEVKMQQDLAAFCRTKIAPRAKMLDRSSRPEACTYMKENLKQDYLWAALCIVAAAFFMFRGLLAKG